MLDLSTIKPNSDNPRNVSSENLEKLKNSISKFGDKMMPLRPIVIDDAGVILGGNMRYKALLELGFTEIPSSWVKRAQDFTSEEKKEFIIKDNVGFGEWDWDILGEWNQSLLSDWGLELQIYDVDEPVNSAGQDEVGELPIIPKSSLGEKWILGNHILYCNDSSMIPIPENCGVFFDPPWDIDYVKPISSSILAFTDCQRQNDVISMLGAPAWIFVWDCVSSWYTPNRPLRRSKLCLWYGDLSRYDFNGSHYGDAGQQRKISNTRGDYMFTPDPRGKHLSDVFQMPITKLHSDSEHSHSKPIDWVRMLIANCLAEPLVFDPYAGSGASMIACEQLNKSCISVEIDPVYVDLIISRWQDFTGKTAIRAIDNMKFDDLIGL